MTIEFSCSHCNKVLKTSDDKAGRRAKCPQCGEPITVPNPDIGSSDEGFESFDEFQSEFPVSEEQSFLADGPVREEDSFLAGGTVDCPMCGATLEANAKKCIHCGETLQVSGHKKWKPRIINVGDVFSRSWQLYKENLGMCIAAPLLGNFLASVAAIAIYIFFIVLFFVFFALVGRNNQAVLGPIMLLLYLAAIAGAVIVSLYFQLGMQSVMLQITHGQDPDIGEIFKGGRFLWRMVLCTLVFGGVIMIGFICLVIPGIVFMLMFWPYSYLLIDRDLPGIDSFIKVREVTQGNLLSLLLISLASIGIYLLGAILTLGFGVIFLLPFLILVQSVAYAEMTNQ